ncbi:MAG: DEAD/DEAH box helicase [Eubacteriales bacterium]|nr:DEAD/DEAH box helicase [Clostridiales bacterium]MDY5836278.1 DEAD/DEAH box helicase [Eubacteriales bacterium]
MTTHIANKLFSDFPISPQIVKALAEEGISQCTSVQALAIGPMLQGRDVIAEAPTGTGKTYAFGIPIIEHIEPDLEAIQGLVLAPTRELAQQIKVEFDLLASHLPQIQSLAVYGGEDMRKQIKRLKKHEVNIIIATPGRLIDHMKRGNVDLSQLKYLVLDEADRMLDMGFIDDVRYIMKACNTSAVKGLFTATLSREVLDISWVYQKHPLEVKVEAQAEDKPDIHQYYTVANGSERISAIEDIMQDFKADKALVFVNMKQSADIAARKLSQEGFSASALQGDMPQSSRNRVMKDFRDGKTSILVGTDVAARGLDVDDVDIVFNYDLPLETENYTHRIGRTGRAGKTGLAFSFVAPGEMESFEKFCRQLRIAPKPYAWERPVVAEDLFISEDKEAEVIARIRSQSSYLQNSSLEDRYDPLQSLVKPSYGSRSGRSKGRGKPQARSKSRDRGSGKGEQAKRSSKARRGKNVKKRDQAPASASQNKSRRVRGPVKHRDF